jgi:leucyl-tRNA---protein transferase
MLVQTHFPRSLSRARYDQYLASGWFRGSVMLYKMDLLCIDECLYSVVNIRMNLDQFSPSARQRKTMRRVESRFTVTYGHAQPNANKEALYAQHKQRFKGFIHNTLTDYLSAGFQGTVFDTREVCVYDGDRLIAVSFFDLGEQSMASLLGLYDEAYSSFSLGTYTLLKEAEYGQRTGRKWFYPGYILDQQSDFDYKLRLGPMEHYTANKRWAKLENFKADTTTSFRIREATEALTRGLKSLGVPSKTWLYPYFSMGYMGPWSAFFLRLPVPVELGHDVEGMLVAGFDPESQGYTLMHIHPCPDASQFLNMEPSSEFSTGEAYLNHLYQTGDTLLAQGSLDELLDLARRWAQRPDALFPACD